MFVCHGNICRSPMAEFVFKKLLNERVLSDKFVVSSSATSTEEIYGNIGNPVYPMAKAELAKHNISCEGKRAIQVQKSDYNNYDLFICMDDNNVRNILRIFGKDTDNKVKKLMDYTDNGGNVSDPWYTRNFEVCYNDILDGCTTLLDKLTTH